jgi:CDP-diacylglycerol--glycerol-3-phosphate 3-phosphatidyltransferase
MSAGTNKSRGAPAAPRPADFRSTVFNLPNQLTWMRLLLSVVMFCLLAFGRGWGMSDRALYLASLALFSVAAGTDWLDGYFARKYDLITTLGRILDPFADKVIICGTFIFLSDIDGSRVDPWMAVIVVGRELLVTALRSYLEQQGADFSATLSGKLKMVFQCAAVVLSFYCLANGAGTAASGVPEWLNAALVASVWGAVLLTVVSGGAYVRTAITLLRA